MEKKSVFLLGMSIVLLLFLAACSQKSLVYVCPGGEQVDDPAKCPPAEQTIQPAEEPTNASPEPTQAIAKAPEAKAVPKPSSGITGMAVRVPTPTVAPTIAVPAPVVTKQSPVTFNVLELKSNTYSLTGITYNVTNNAQDILNAAVLVYLETSKQNERLRVKQFDLPRVKMHGSKTVRLSLDIELVKKNTPQKVYFSVVDHSSTANTVLATAEYSLQFH